MKLAKTISTLLILLMSCTACAGEPVTLNLTVVDQDGNPESGVDARIAFIHPQAKQTKGYTRITDEDGRIKITKRGSLGIGISLNKEGYYKSRHRTGYGDQTLTMEIREIKKPIVMTINRIYKKGAFRKTILDHGPDLGFDLEVGDFVSPIGKGKVPDLILSANSNYQDLWNRQFNLSVRFKNSLDGFVPFKITSPERLSDSQPVSLYKSDYLAPSGGYINEWDYERSRAGKDKPFESTFDKNRNYYFRVRTETDDEGNIVSAHYGKIYGEFMEGTFLTFFFNPTPNDRNVEADLTRSLTGKKIRGDILP